MLSRSIRLALAALAGSSSLIGCQLVFPTIVASDSGPIDSGPIDSGPAPTRYNELAARKDWETFELGGNTVFSGGTFDGRWVYYGPRGGRAVRYDTQGAFNHEASWERFDTKGLAGTGDFFSGAAFDGRYVYLVPNYDLRVGVKGHVVIVRFDTEGSFIDAGAWSTFDLTAGLGTATLPFAGATFDGRYLYLAPNAGSVAARYDTMADFGSKSSWLAFDMTMVSTVAGYMVGAVFDGRFVYFVPSNNPSGADSTVMRYDTHGSFQDKASWEAFLTLQLGPDAFGYAGGAFDGRHVYLAPDLDFVGFITRYDTRGPFKQRGSWSGFESNQLSAKANGFIGAAFDGRYVYMIPFLSRKPAGVIARYDTTGSFGSVDSWSTFDISTLASSGVGFAGAVFDGQYLYLVPDAFTTAFRFHAREPSAMPALPEFHGSFF